MVQPDNRSRTSLRFEHATLGQRVLFGSGEAVDHVAAAVADLGAARAFVIADHFAIALTEAVAQRVPVVARLHDVIEHVPAGLARRAVDLSRRESADVVITIGGGSSTGLGKIVARDTGLPIIAVPTTFAGSEATDVWGVTENDRKVTGTDQKVLPKVVVYDASLSASLDPGLAVASGLNAVAHAVDGFWAPRADPINIALGSEALRALVPGLRRIRADGSDLEGREQSLYGAYLAAVAFASAGSGMHHKICHVLGGAYGLPHAAMHAVLLPHVLAFNAYAAPDAAARVSAVLDGGPPARALHALGRELGAPRSLGSIGLRKEQVPEAARLASQAIPPSNPRPVAVAELETLLRAAWAGDLA